MKISILGPAIPKEIIGTSTESPIGMGGAPINALALLLHNRGHEVTIITGSPEIQKVWDSGKGQFPRVICVPFRPSVRQCMSTFYSREIAKLAEITSEVPADIVHAHWTYEFALAGMKSRKETIVTLRDIPLIELRVQRSPGTLVRFAMAIYVRLKVRNLTANSPYARRVWKRQMLDWRDIPFVPNAIPLPRGINVRRPAKERTPIQNFLLISSNRRVKNNSVFFEAWKILAEQRPSLHLTVVGETLTRDYIERLVGDLPPNVTIMGGLNRTELFELFTQVDILVHPSRVETFGNVIVEAISQGVPVVGNEKCEAVSWVLDDGKCGTLIPMKDPDDIASSLSKIIDNPNMLAHKAEVAVDSVMERFSDEVVGSEWEKVYDKLVPPRKADENLLKSA